MRFFKKHFRVDLEAVDFKTSLVYRQEEELFHAWLQCHAGLSLSDISGPVHAAAAVVTCSVWFV